MGLQIRDIRQARQVKDSALEPNRYMIQVVLCSVDGSVTVEGKEWLSWARPMSSDGPPFAVLNQSVEPREGVPVFVAQDPKSPYTWKVIGVDDDKVTSPTYNTNTGVVLPYLGLHHASHEWPDRAPGADAVSTYIRALVPLRTMAGASDLTVRVLPLMYCRNGTRAYFPGTTNHDLSGYVPASGYACSVLIYLDPNTNTVVSSAGGTVLDSDAVATLFIDPPSGTLPSAYVRLAGGQASVTEADIWDARMVIQAMDSVPGGGGTGGGGGSGGAEQDIVTWALPCCGA